MRALRRAERWATVRLVVARVLWPAPGRRLAARLPWVLGQYAIVCVLIIAWLSLVC
jgi:hypothetical protein